MIGLGTIINVTAIIVGGLLGLLGGKWLNERRQETIIRGMAVCVMFVGIAGVMENMLTVTDGKLGTQGTLMFIVSIALGGLIGEILNIDGAMVRFGEWLKRKTGNSGDNRFLDAFITATMTVCIGAMAIVGSVEDGIHGDYTILAAKALLDFVIILVMTASLGKGCIFSAIPVAVFQGCFTVLARLIQPLLTEAALCNLSLVGSALIFCVGVNLIWKNTIRVANLLPSIIFAVIFAVLGI